MDGIHDISSTDERWTNSQARTDDPVNDVLVGRVVVFGVLLCFEDFKLEGNILFLTSFHL